MKFQKILIPYLAILISGCSDKKNIEPIINLSQVINEPVDSLFQQLGEITRSEDHSGKYPCEKSNCSKVVFQNGKFEVITRNGEVEWITINNIPDYSGNRNALEYLGLPNTSPDFINPRTVARWENHSGINEISFFTDYALIIFRNPD